MAALQKNSYNNSIILSHPDMVNFETICILQPYKCASTYMYEFFSAHSCEKLINHHKHAVPATRDNRFLYITTIRNPIELYVSQYQYGIEGKSGLRRTLESGFGLQLYDDDDGSFNRWLLLVNSEMTLDVLDERNKNYRERGFASWRTLRYATFDFSSQSETVDVVLRVESLRNGLSDLVANRISYAITDPARAIDWIERSPFIKMSKPKLWTQSSFIQKSTLAMILHHDRELFAYYPDYETKCENLLDVGVGEEIPLRALL